MNNFCKRWAFWTEMWAIHNTNSQRRNISKKHEKKKTSRLTSNQKIQIKQKNKCNSEKCAIIFLRQVLSGTGVTLDRHSYTVLLGI